MKLRGRPVAPGLATSVAIVSGKALSFLGGVDLSTGAVTDPASDVRGESVSNRVLAFPHGKGSTVGSYVLYGLARRGFGPSAIVNERTEAIVATGSILGNIPLVDRIDIAILATGDTVTVDGTRGTVEVVGLTERPVVTAFLRHRGRILVLRRGQGAPTFPGRWSGVSGVIEGAERPIDRVRKEIREETGISGARLRARGPIVRARHGESVFAVHPFLFDVMSRRVRIDAENQEFRWIRPGDIDGLETVPRLRETFDAVAKVV